MHLTDQAARRLAWIAFGLVCLGYLAIAAFPFVVRATTDLDPLDRASWSDFLLGAFSFAFPLVGVLVANREPKNAVGWVLIAVGLVIAAPLSVWL